jgi:hypothetical protein
MSGEDNECKLDAREMIAVVFFGLGAFVATVGATGCFERMRVQLVVAGAGGFFAAGWAMLQAAKAAAERTAERQRAGRAERRGVLAAAERIIRDPTAPSAQADSMDKLIRSLLETDAPASAASSVSSPKPGK